MRNYAPLLGLAMLVIALPARAQTPDIDEIWAIVQQQQQEIEDLKRQLADADAQLAVADQKIEATGDYLDTIAVPVAQPKTQLGGYGEIALQQSRRRRQHE